MPHGPGLTRFPLRGISGLHVKLKILILFCTKLIFHRTVKFSLEKQTTGLAQIVILGRFMFYTEFLFSFSLLFSQFIASPGFISSALPKQRAPFLKCFSPLQMFAEHLAFYFIESKTKPPCQARGFPFPFELLCALVRTGLLAEVLILANYSLCQCFCPQ